MFRAMQKDLMCLNPANDSAESGLRERTLFTAFIDGTDQYNIIHIKAVSIKSTQIHRALFRSFIQAEKIDSLECSSHGKK